MSINFFYNLILFLKNACWIVSSLNDELPGEARGAEDDEVVPSRHRGRLLLGIQQVRVANVPSAEVNHECLS